MNEINIIGQAITIVRISGNMKTEKSKIVNRLIAK
jgi:hypothetical protein